MSRAPARRTHNLTEDEIVDAALELVRTVGLEQLTMRRLAEELDVTPMAAYHYVRSKDELLQLVADTVLSRIPSTNRGSWEARLRTHSMACWDALTAYPGLGAFLLERPLARPTRALVGQVMEFFRSSGFDEREAMLAYATYHTYMYGLLSMEARFRPLKRSTSSGDKALLADVELRDFVEFGLDTMIAGLRARVRASKRAAAR